jgi:hypothetical protein
MDQAFACPECGTMVEVEGLAAGRQVRCGFCHRLLEVPYLPRVEVSAWKRTRFVRPRWVTWAWCGLGVLMAAVVLTAVVRFVDRHERAARDRSIHQLMSSSEGHERSGKLDQALVDLDAALDLCAQAPPGDARLITQLRAKRETLVRQEALAVMERLSTHDSPTFPLGEWLTLQARTLSDNDLAPLRQEVVSRFQARLKGRIETDLAAARAAFEAGNPVLAYDACAPLTGLISHSVPPAQEQLRIAVEDLVARIIDRHGLLVDPPRGHFLAGSESRYNASMIPILSKALRAKGYLPHLDDHAGDTRWSHAPYRLSLVLNERLEGNYLSSENRLTRIDAQLTLAFRGKEIWKTTPSARTVVPLPRIPAYLSSRVALGSTRIDEFERLLYDNARSMIDEKFAFALNHMPGCGQFSDQAGL